ncbi:MAG: alpha/beta hydrolase, partial [Propioniciclava sp.]
RIIQVYGDLATADEVIIHVPGMTTDLDNYRGDGNDAAQSLYQIAGEQSSKRIAVVSFADYDVPRAADAALGGPAKAGAENLRGLVADLESMGFSRDKVSVTAHSYGSRVVGEAMKQGLPVREVVVAGSPGMGSQDRASLGSPEVRLSVVTPGALDPVPRFDNFRLNSPIAGTSVTTGPHGLSTETPGFGAENIIQAQGNIGHSRFYYGDTGRLIIDELVTSRLDRHVSYMTGADIEDLEAGASRLASIGTRIGGMARPLRSQWYSSHWHGGAANRFRSEWDSVHSRALADAEAFLRNAGDQLRREADQQRSTSSGGGSGSVGSALSPARIADLIAGIGASTAWAGSKAVTERSGTWSSPGGLATVDGRIAAGSISGDASAEIGPDRASASVQGRLALLEAQAGGRFGNEYLGASAKGDAMAGAEAGLGSSVSLGMDGVSAKLGGEGFAGARASGSGTVDIGGVGAGGTAEARAGVGIKGGATGSVSLDEVSVSVSFGVALGVGGSLGGKVSVSPKKVL